MAIKYLLPLLAVLLATTLHASPFCCFGVRQTLSEEMDGSDTVVVAKLLKITLPDPAKGEENEVSTATFQVLDVLKGDALVDRSRIIEVPFFGDETIDGHFLLMGTKYAPERLDLVWNSPVPIPDRAEAYVRKLPSLPKDIDRRLAFFHGYLGDENELLARDAFDEFDVAPYAAVKKLKGAMRHDQLLRWIKDEATPASRRRLFLKMLGVCGNADDIPMLEAMLKANGRDAKSARDAKIACYLTLMGEKGLPLVEDLFIRNTKADYADTYSAIIALRFHATEGGVIEQPRIVQSTRLMLKRPELADLVIPDLRRYRDWDSMEELVMLFKTADVKESWVRVPVINYLRACPLPQAGQHLAELEELDYASFARAKQFFP